MEANCVFCCSNRISFNLPSHTNEFDYDPRVFTNNLSRPLDAPSNKKLVSIHLSLATSL